MLGIAHTLIEPPKAHIMKLIIPGPSNPALDATKLDVFLAHLAQGCASQGSSTQTGINGNTSTHYNASLANATEIILRIMSPTTTLLPILATYCPNIVNLTILDGVDFQPVRNIHYPNPDSADE